MKNMPTVRLEREEGGHQPDARERYLDKINNAENVWKLREVLAKVPRKHWLWLMDDKRIPKNYRYVMREIYYGSRLHLNKGVSGTTQELYELLGPVWTRKEIRARLQQAVGENRKKTVFNDHDKSHMATVELDVEKREFTIRRES